MIATLDLTMADQLGWALVHSLWQAAVIAALLAAALRFLRHRSSDVRYAIACVALLLQVSLPVATLLHTHSGTAPSAADPLSSPVRTDPLESLVHARPPELQSPPATVQRIFNQFVAALRPAFPWCVGLWALGVLGLTLWRLLGWVGVQRLWKASDEVPTQWLLTLDSIRMRLGITQPVRLLQSVRIEVPIMIGLFRPVILLPASTMTGLPPDLVSALLAHELAHIRRCDYLVNLLQTAIEILMFYHPAVWWVSRQIRQERENCCDDIAAAACGDRVLYARALTSMEELRCLPGELALAANSGSLIARIRRLLAPTPQADKSRGTLGAIAMVAGTLALLIAYVYLTPGNTALAAEAAAPTTTAAAAQPTWPPPLSPLRPDDFDAQGTQYLIGPSDLLSVSITGLSKPDAKAVMNARVSPQGAVSLGEIGEIKAAGRSAQQLKSDIAAWMKQNRGITDAPVTVTVLEARQRTFTLLGLVQKPGQYPIADADFHLRDALALGGAPAPGAQAVYVIRGEPSPPTPPSTRAEKRTMRVPLKQLTSQPDAWNIVIRPGDMLLVPPPDNAPATQPH